ncbi:MULTISPECIES: hypothetical protein [unclassified Coleofasciculus]|uniref:hypothetical protein n=1 Tax=unclassified Coleofasciculus TaxID=2692782 RepID=UPI0018813E31|nr:MULTISPECIES: hypothetical protein [unclassified Coleofasciculus]MBE9126317.1 hypothetical protein [Coleofasciculus sp. LEGE 07081]MBE9147506.1 hypothetical protein [Coleofasciculus sp. LEGE 07092]
MLYFSLVFLMKMRLILYKKRDRSSIKSKMRSRQRCCSSDRICCRFEPVVCHSSNPAKSNINWRDSVLGVGLLFEKASPTCFNPTDKATSNTF